TWALAYWTHPERWGEGYATEGAQCVIKFGFERLGAASIWAGAAEWNHASNRVLEKLGMVHMSDNPQGY
ncbi:MAG: GNAT family N-acetyltransferase, partial [Anaerolineae bacterium]|nr:GNAT family N-acetyltransferase [Anaerolineae bacterium]NIN98098.1 GNAT family N-acetyltransferase [Anaerolineae bacterium]NIQ81044.1 GNAT family N-acetyltransferase [Anaerolineae bacterium]